MSGDLKAKVYSETVEDGKKLKQVWHSEITDLNNKLIFKSLGSESEADAREELRRYCERNNIKMTKSFFAYMPPD